MDFDAIIVGGGFAGLSAGAALVERGARVLLLEARPTLGGRATAFTDPATGERVDNGQHVLLGCYHETFRFLRRIGAESNVRMASRLAVDFVDRRGHTSRLECPPLPPPLHLLGGVLKWNALGWRDKLGALGLWKAGASGDSETVRDWLVSKGQTPRTIEMLWEPLAVAALNQPIDSAGAESFRTVLARMLAPPASNAALAIPAKPLDQMYALPARDFIEARGGTVRTGAQAAIACRGGSINVMVKDEEYAAPAVICAVPWHGLEEVFHRPPPELAPIINAAGGTAPSPIVTVNLWFDRVVTTHPFVGLPGRTMQWVFDKRTVFGESASHLSLVSSGAEAVVALSNRELTDLAMREVSHALPASRAATLRRAVVVREKRATFSVAPGAPRRPSTRTAIAGLFLAGDWIDTGLPATIEGAVASGHLAADAASS